MGKKGKLPGSKDVILYEKYFMDVAFNLQILTVQLVCCFPLKSEVRHLLAFKSDIPHVQL